MRFLFRLVYFFPLFFAYTASAFAPCAVDHYELIAPFGSLPMCVDLQGYMQGIFTSAIGIAGILAVIMIVWCGIKLMTAGSVSGKNEAKECITNAIFGVLIAIGSWLLLNTINPLLLLNKPLSLTSTGNSAPTPPHTPRTQAPPTGLGCYFQYKDLTTGDTVYSHSDTCQACELIRNNFQIDKTHYQILGMCYEPTKTTSPPASTPPPVTSAGSVSCPMSGTNLCETKFRQCTNPKCAQFAGMASAHAGGVVSAELIKAIILQESSCVATESQLVGDGGSSCGPMHIQPATANKFLALCNVPAPVTCGWLVEKKNWDKAICLSAEYLRSLSSKCGSNIQDISAGYNGGPGVCSASTDCAGDLSCSGNPVKRWECLYDDIAHQQCNAGYNSTRNYAMSVNYCTTHPAY